jgi:hypothetical protein
MVVALHIKFPNRSILLFCLILVLLTAGNASAEVMNGTIGEVIPVSGTAPTADMVYLFMTGPVIPSQGSRMDSSISPVVTGKPDTFTQVPVEGDNWSYSWQTGRVSGGLAPGLYTVYAATAPVAKNALSGVPYSSMDIYLSQPVTTGTIEVQSVPSKAQVEVNGKYAGNTPIDLPGLSPGTYQVTISLSEYVPYTELVNLSAGETKQISVNLESQSPLTATSAVPMPSPESMETTVVVPSTKAPLSIAMVLLCILTGLVLTVWVSRR